MFIGAVIHNRQKLEAQNIHQLVNKETVDYLTIK